MLRSVKYLIRPLELFAEVRRIPRAGGRVIVSFSNRWFPTKAVRIWSALDEAGRASPVPPYLERSGFASIAAYLLADSKAGDPLVVVASVTQG